MVFSLFYFAVDQSVYIARCSGRFALQAGITARKSDSSLKQQRAGTLTAQFLEKNGQVENSDFSDFSDEMVRVFELAARQGRKLGLLERVFVVRVFELAARQGRKLGLQKTFSISNRISPCKFSHVANNDYRLLMRYFDLF